MAYQSVPGRFRPTGLFFLVVLLSTLGSVSASPRINVLSPSGEVWIQGTDVACDVNITGTDPNLYAVIDWDDSLVGWWRGEGDANDSSLYGNHATLADDANALADGVFGQAFTGGSIVCDDLNAFAFRNTDSFTLSAWIGFHSNPSGTTTLIQKGTYNLRLYYHNSNQAWQFTLGNDDNYVTATGNDYDVGGRWCCITVVHDASSRQLKLYLDGGTPVGGQPVKSTEGVGQPYTAVERLTFFCGTNRDADEIMMFNRALDANEVAALYDATAQNMHVTFGDCTEFTEYDYTVWAVNSSGDVNNVSGSILVDRPHSAPEVTAITPLTPYRSSESSHTFTVTARNTNSGTMLASAQLYWDYEQTWGPAGDPIALSGQEDTAFFEKTGLSDATITWNVLVTDSAGNSGFVDMNQNLMITRQTDYYVSPAGDDSLPGTIDQPFRTLQRVADLALPGDTCWIREGVYRETVTPANSGNAAAPITFKAYPGETVTISGADIVDGGWTVHEGHIYKTTAMDWDMGEGKNQIFVEGEPMWIARWPNETTYFGHRTNGSRIDTGSHTSSLPYTLDINDTNLTHDPNYWQGAYLWATWSPFYYGITGTVTSSDMGTLTAELMISPHGTHEPEYRGYYYLFNTLNALDSAGEWYFDPNEADGTLYLWAPDNADPGALTVEAKARQNGFVLDGKSYITIEGIDLFACNLTTDSESEHLVIDGINARYLSHYRLIEGGNMSAGRFGHRDTGIILDGSGHTLQDSTIAYSAGNGVSLIGNECTVSNCDISYTNYTRTAAAGVNSGIRRTLDNRLEHSKVYYAGRHCVELSYAQRISVVHNELHDNNHGRYLSDLAVIGLIWSDLEEGEIAYNYVYNYYYAGIYFDHNVHNARVHHNVIWGPQLSGRENAIHINTPFVGNYIAHNSLCPESKISVNSSIHDDPDMKVYEDNVIVHNTAHSLPSSALTDRPTANIIRNNIRVGGTAPGTIPEADVYENPDVNDFRPRSDGAARGYVITKNNLGRMTDDRTEFWFGQWPLVSGSVTIYKNSVVQTEGFEIDYENGTVTFDEYLPSPWIYATYQFDPQTEYDGAELNYTEDILGNPMNDPPDIGAYQYVEDLAGGSYVLHVSARYGAVSRSPEKATYTPGETVTLQAVPNDGYVFVGWAGDLSGRANPAQIVMDERKYVTARFAEISTNTYSLHTTSTYGGSIVRTPDRTTFRPGETVTLRAVPIANYAFAGWSGGASGYQREITITMDGSKLITASFGVGYALDTYATNGFITRMPDKALYIPGEEVTLVASPQADHAFTGWSGHLSGSSNPATLSMDGDKSVTAHFIEVDNQPPVLSGLSPEADAIQVPLNSLMVLRVSDAGAGVDANTVRISVDGGAVYAGDVPSYSSATGTCRRSGDASGYTYAYQRDGLFDWDETVTIAVDAADLAGNAMPPTSFSFKTQMRAFGGNEVASWGPHDVDKGGPATVCDSGGNVWTVWQAGENGERDIYVSCLLNGAANFGGPIQVTDNWMDQCNPVIALGTDDSIYVAWQDNRQGSWDIYLATSMDGAVWSSPVRITDSDAAQTHPAIAVDGESPNRAYVAWQDDEAGNQDIYLASSTDGFASSSISRLTYDLADQVAPRLAIDTSATVYAVWTDRRNGSDDVYGAASNDGPWTNVPVVTGSGNQSAPAIAAEPTGSTLHFVWTDDVLGDADVVYASSVGLPSSPLAGANLADDMLSDVDQSEPSVAVARDAAGQLRIFACWQDERNLTVNGQDTDLYFVEIRPGSDTNVLVGDGFTQSNQSEPALAVDPDGRPFVVWTDHRNANDEIYYAHSTFVEPTPLESNLVTAAAGGTVGTASPATASDVSVAIPAGACPYDVTVTVSRIRNLQPDPDVSVLPYEFGPSGLQFAAPVTVTIPYAVADFSGEQPVAYWHDALTGSLSQEGITNVAYLTLSSDLHALRFDTMHFTPYLLVGADETPSGGTGGTSGGGGGGGGGCSLTKGPGQADPAGFLLPFVVLAAIMAGLRYRDRRRHSV